MDELQKLYDVLIRDGYYTKSFDDFKVKFQDPEYQDKVYGVVERDGLFTKGKDEFIKKYISSPVDDQSMIAEPVKKKEESVPLWLQKQEQEQPKQEQTLPFLESKPSGISLGSQRVPETAPMFEAPPMRTAEEAQAIVEAPEYREAKYFEGTFGELLSNMDNPAISPNTAWIGMGDFVDDFGRAIGQGSKTGDIVAPTSKIFLNGAKTSDEDIEKFRQASELADKLGPSDEMFRFSKEYQESGKTTSGFLKALAMNPGAIPEIMVSSYSAMVNSTSLAAGGAVVGTGATTGAAAGAAAGGVGAIPGAVAGAIASIPYAMAAMGATLETNLSLAESIKDKLAQDGLEWNDENIKSVISDEKFLKDARIKAATRGVTIGAIDALTGRVAGKVGAKILKAPKGGAVKSAVAAGSIEAAGGSTGEATARALTGQEMDIAEIGLEGIAELPGTVVSVGSEVLRKPLYKVNGEIRPEADIKEIVETADGDQLAKINIEITNDDKGYNEQIQEKVVSAQVKNEVKEVNPDLDEETVNEITRLEMQLKKVEGKKTQSAKDKAADIRSQIKTLQENAVQKPSTEESVLRAEESQVGLQEVGEGNAQVQAPTEEVVQEEVVTADEDLQAALDRIEIPEDTEVAQPIKAPRNKAERKEAARRGDMVYHNFDGSIIESTREQYDNALKEIAETGAIENVFNYGKEVSSRQAPNELEIQYEPSLLYMKKEDADSDLKRRTKVEEITDKAAEAVSPATPVAEAAPKVSSKTPKAKSVPIPVAIPKPTPKPAEKAKTKSESFFDVTDKEFPNDHILGGYAVTDEDGGLIGRVSIEEFDDNTVKINEVVSEKRGQRTGNGRKIMEKITKLADENGISLTLVPNIIGEMKAKGFETPQKLKDFYKKFGFVVEPNTGRMTRKPIAKVKAPAPAPAPAPKPVAVVSEPTAKAVGPDALRQEYINKTNDVRLNKDKSRTPKQIDERVAELKAEYQKLKAEMTAPRPKAEPEAKAAPKGEAKPAPKKAAPVIKSKFQEAQDFADKLSAMSQEERDDVEFNENYRGYQLFEARKAMPKTSNSPKFKKVNEDNSSTLYNDYEYIANIDGEPYGLVKYEDPDDPDNDKAFVWAYEKVGTDDLFQTWTSDNEELISEIKSQISKEVKATPKAEPTSVVEEEEPSYDDIKDLDVSDPTLLEIVEGFIEDMEDGLENFGRGNLSSGIAIPLAKAILKSLKVLVRAGIKIEDAIKRLATQNSLEEKDIVKMIKDIDKAQSAMKKLKDQIKAEARSATDAKNDMNQKRKNLSKVISEIEASGKISAFKAQAVINKIGKLNLDSKASVDKFIDYAGKVFADAEYANKLNTAKDTRSQIRKLSKLKEKFANLRDLGSKFAGIDPSMVEDIDEYNEMATLIRDSIKGSTTRKADVKFANMMKESDAMAYINKAMEAQQKMLLSQKQAEVQELLDIDASDLTYDQLIELVNDDKPLTKYNEGLIRAAINKAFRVYSSMIDASMRNGQDVFTEEGVAYTTNQKKVVKEFMSMDLNVLSPKQALESVDALVNFLQNQSIAKMESVLAKYKGETEMRAIEKKGIKAKPVRKYWSKGLGRLLLEQTANLPIVFERMFGGFTKGGMVEDAMGVTALKNGKSKAQSESNNIVNRYVDKFYKLKPNGEVFNTAFNNIERGMVAFMSRNVFGTDSETKVEFKRRRDLIEQSTKELEKGNEQEVAKAKVYQEVYDKVLKDSDSIEQVQGKAAPENLEAVKFWQEEWSDKYEQLYDTALGVYNKILEKDMNYSMPDRYSKLSSDTGEVDITTEDMGFLINSGTAPLYKKETGVLMAATRPESLPKSKGTSKTNRYIDLSFDNTNSNAMYDALVDINTAAPIRQVQSALNSDAFARIMKGTGDEKLIKNRIDLYVRNIRNKNPFSNDEFSKAVKNLNRLASVGVGQALGGVLQPVKQVAPIAMNTVINAGGLDIPSIFDLAKQKFMDKSGYAIGNRGVESQAQIESLNKMIEEAAKSKPEQAIKAIEKINNWWLKSFLVKPDVYIARASWMTYYEQSLKKQGIDPASIDYNTHEINEEAANYAQRQVDRQQNVSDSDLAGALLSDKDASKQLFVKVLMPFASFRMNQSARLGSDLSTIMDKTATKEDKEIATRSLGGFAVEMAVFRAVSAASALLIAAVVKGVMGRDDDEEKDKKKNDAIVKGQLTSTVADVFSPTPLLDKGIQIGASAVLDATQDALDISEEEKLEIYSGNKQDFFQSLGLLGISGARASQLYEMSVLAAGGSYEDDYGRKKYLSEKDRDAIATLIPIAIVSNIGLAPSEVNSIVRSSLADAKRSGTTVESEQSKRKSEESKIMGLNKTDLKRYYPEIYEQYYGAGSEAEAKRKLEYEKNLLERKMKDDYYNYVPKKRPKKGSINRQGINRGGINRGSRGSK